MRPASKVNAGPWTRSPRFHPESENSEPAEPDRVTATPAEPSGATTRQTPTAPTTTPIERLALTQLPTPMLPRLAAAAIPARAPRVSQPVPIEEARLVRMELLCRLLIQSGWLRSPTSALPLPAPNSVAPEPNLMATPGSRPSILNKPSLSSDPLFTVKVSVKFPSLFRNTIMPGGVFVPAGSFTNVKQ